MAIPSKRIYSPLETTNIHVDRERLALSLPLIYPEISSRAGQWITFLIDSQHQNYSLAKEFGGPFIAETRYLSLYSAVRAYQAKVMNQDKPFLIDLPFQIQSLEDMVVIAKNQPPDPLLHFLALAGSFFHRKNLVNA